MVTEQRKQYIRNWKKDNKEKIRKNFREWYKNNRDKPYYKNRTYTPKKAGEEYAGTSGLGRKYELIAHSMLQGSTLSDNFHAHWDLKWNGLKIDVKMRNKNNKGNYLFSRKPKCEATHFLCFCIDKKIKYILLIPKNKYGYAIQLTDKKIETTYRKYIFIIKEQ